MRDVENDRSLSNSGRSTPTRGHRDVAHKPPSVASPLTTPNESSSTSARALRAIETQDAARRAPGGLSRREVRDDDARRREGTTRGRRGDVSEKALGRMVCSPGWGFVSLGRARRRNDRRND